MIANYIIFIVVNFMINKLSLIIMTSLLMLGMMLNSWAVEEPHFVNNTLTIPSVAVDFDPGRFVNVQFHLAADGRWDLVNATPVEQQPTLPQWLTTLIEKLSTAPVANPPAQIIQYQYNDATVYYLPPQCCDIMGVLYDVDGHILCHPDGGIVGRGDGKCPDFHRTKAQKLVIWRDERDK
jgi:hypothetical protein